MWPPPPMGWMVETSFVSTSPALLRRIFPRAAALGAAHQGGLIVRRHVHRTDIVHVVLLPRVDGLPHQGELPDGVRGDPENPRGAFFQLFHPAADREGDILNPYHFDHLGNSVPRLSGMHNGNCGEQGGSRGN